MRTVFPTKALRDEAIEKYHAIEGGQQTLSSLAAYVTEIVRKGVGEGGEEGRDNDIARETFERTGASVMGKRMFDAGEQAWPEEAPFHTPVFVVTHEKRDVRIAGGGATILGGCRSRTA
jgi:hypothetical protein